MTLFETIFKRRSVRKYIKTSLPPDVLDSIQARLDGLKQLEGQSARFEIVSAAAIKKDKAPHYILAFCEKKAEAFINVGYCLQEIDLFIQSMGLGSLWLGTAKLNKGEKKDLEGKDFCIMFAFGGTDVPFRTSEKDFDRLETSAICNSDNNIIQAARLAPSAVNSQPWLIDFEEGKILINYCGRGLLKAILRPKFSKIDIGIIAKHTEIALKNYGKTDISVLLTATTKSFGVSILYS